MGCGLRRNDPYRRLTDSLAPVMSADGVDLLCERMSTRVFRRQVNSRLAARKRRRFEQNVMASLARWRKRRAVEGLNEPYGERAAELFGERFRLPPSDRSLGPPKPPPGKRRGRAKATLS